MTTTTIDRRQLLDTCEKHWGASAAKLYRIAGSQVEAEASDCEVRDHAGRRYLDFACSYGVFIVGHRHPTVRRRVDAQLAQMASLAHGTIHPTQQALTERLKALAPGQWGDVHYMLSGAEAVEHSLRYVLAANAPRCRIVITAGAYHGKTLAAMSILGQRQHEASFGKLATDVVIVPYGDMAAMREAIGDGACAVYLEPILGGAHLRMPPLGYLQDIRALCDRTGTLLVADEIQTAFGRCGKMFAVEYAGIEPDILILSKGLTGGYASIACVMYRQQTLERLPAPQDDRGSCGGHPFACAAALAALDVIEEEGLLLASVERGQQLRQGLMALARRFPDIIEDVPGIGLMTGLRLKGAVYESLLSMELGKRNVHTGHSMNERAERPVLRYYPPLTVSAGTIDDVLGRSREALEAVAAMPAWKIAVMRRVTRSMYRLPNALLRKL
ncbi:aspartate aminotransferase family protein [Paraburkholderia kururiensis]|uniref:aspartate aminotransferase family protein n=1 Tax=Paraburkholderia kururiensis TaxID=984307 RepID=UPI000F86835A|nr:aminotransferase class III-fold pyridoxal phosphate-dependent enzyme [Paraburkholderia kururiensis]